MSRGRASQGFTLVELMVALGVVGLLTVLAVPNFRQWVNNQQTRTVAESLADALRLAQSNAVHQNRSVTFCLTNSSPSNSLVSSTLSACVANGKNWFAQFGQLGQLQLFSDETAGPQNNYYYVQGGSFYDVAPNVLITGPAYITFNSLGRALITSGVAASGNRSYKLTNSYGDGRYLAVTVDIGGQIRLCDGSRSDQSSTDGCPATLP